MVREFKLPDVGEGLSEAEIVAWLVEVGDPVSEDQPVAEVETDKAVVEVPAPVHGTVREIRAEEGEMVPVGEVIITFDVAGEADAEAATSEPPTETETETEPGPEPESRATDATGTGTGATETSDAAADDGASVPEGRVFAAPSARRLARELGVSIASVEGSGPGGRVTEADVRAAAESGGEREETPEPAGRERTLAAPATRRLADEEGVDLDDVPTDERRDGEPFVGPEQVRAYAEAQRAAQAADAAAVRAGDDEAAASAGNGETAPEAAATTTGERPEERVPYRGVRRTIGQQMERSKFTAPHVTHHDEVDVTALVEARSRLREEAADRGVTLSYVPFVVRAVVAALKQYPIVNSQLDEEREEIVKKGYYNIGIATATDAGLMVPVVEDADDKGLLELAEEINDLAARARDRSIAREEMQGGTFTITNFGAIGGEYGTPIINYPETAILGLGEIKEKPRVVDGEASDEAASKEIVPRHVLTLSMSVDHRVIDGAEAARFTNTVKRYLETPELLLLA
jgi:pyruvate dehydrogenase E2 component (dihydrolipoamide acetyltransferase)